MANNISVKIRADGLKEFDKIFSEYQKWNKRQGADIVNAKLYFIALNAMQTTKTADKTKIATELMAPAQKYPTVPLAAILVNKQLTAKNKKGLNGLKMTEAIKRYIKKSISRTQFLRSGWIPAIKKLDYWNKQGDISFVKRFSPASDFNFSLFLSRSTTNSAIPPSNLYSDLFTFSSRLSSKTI